MLPKHVFNLELANVAFVASAICHLVMNGFADEPFISTNTYMFFYVPKCRFPVSMGEP